MPTSTARLYGLLLTVFLLLGGIFTARAADGPALFPLKDVKPGMKGVAYTVSQDLLISDLSHENPSIFAGAYRLYQTEQFWAAGTVFVAVVGLTSASC